MRLQAFSDDWFIRPDGSWGLPETPRLEAFNSLAIGRVTLGLREDEPIVPQRGRVIICRSRKVSPSRRVTYTREGIGSVLWRLSEMSLPPEIIMFLPAAARAYGHIEKFISPSA